jgi:hypothetical protein
MADEANTVTDPVYQSYTKEWYENVVLKDPELLKWFNETVMAAEYYDVWKD